MASDRTRTPALRSFLDANLESREYREMAGLPPKATAEDAPLTWFELGIIHKTLGRNPDEETRFMDRDEAAEYLKGYETDAERS
jgi:hypothetical protein